jgi:hypothetical protein
MAANWWAYEFWRFVFVQQEVGKAAQTFLDFPSMQKGGSFNLQALKEELDKKMASHSARWCLFHDWCTACFLAARRSLASRHQGTTSGVSVEDQKPRDDRRG